MIRWWVTWMGFLSLFVCLFIASYIPLLELKKLAVWDCQVQTKKKNLSPTKACYLYPKEEDRGSLERENVEIICSSQTQNNNENFHPQSWHQGVPPCRHLAEAVSKKRAMAFVFQWEVKSPTQQGRRVSMKSADFNSCPALMSYLFLCKKNFF